MKLNKYIEGLQKLLKEYGNHECYYAIDDEGNGYQKVIYNGTRFFIPQCDKEEYRLDSIYSEEDIVDYEEDPTNFVPVIVIN